MIPDIAIIISAYAAARLLLVAVIPEHLTQLRTAAALAGIVVIGIALADVLQNSQSLTSQLGL